MDGQPVGADPGTPPRGPHAPREDLHSSRGGRGRGSRRRGGPNGDSVTRGRGRGRGHDRRLSETQPVDPTKPALQAKEVRRTSTTGSTDGLIQTNGQAPNQETIEEDEEVEVCFICASAVEHNSIAPCNHRTCHICALRLRALYKTKACAHCRSSAEYVIFTDDGGKRFEDFSHQEFAKSDPSLGIHYGTNNIYEDTVLLLRYNCPEVQCEMACYGWPDLHRHVRNVHHRIMCDLCTRNKKVFTHEHELFTHTELRKHEKFGDDNPGAVDQSGFKGHPECGFCNQRFYGDDELYTHCRDKHERCHICDRNSSNSKQQYYMDYNELEKHFGSVHFLCPDSECMEQKFVVFDSEIDLKAHQLAKHPHGLSKEARRDARRVDMRGFENYRSSQEEERGGRRREGRGRGRGRDPNTDEPLPISSAQHLTRAEIASQRQMAIHSAQSVSNRTFGGQLTSGNAFAARGPPPGQQPSTVTASVSNQANGTRPMSSSNANPPSLEYLNLSNANPPPLTAVDKARQLRHTSVVERASNLLGNDQSRLAKFRSNISSYRNSEMTATQLVDFFFVIFDTDSTSLGTLVRELADIFEIPSKKDDLLKAWNDWRAINEDYPSLPGPNGMPAGGASGSTGSGGKRILKLKSSTAQSSRSSVSQARSWGTANAPTSSGNNPFPGLPGANVRTTQGKAWGASNATTSSARSTSTRAVAQAPARPLRTAAVPASAELFPSLPAAQKPGMNAMRPGALGGPTIRENRSGTSTPSNAWAAGGLGGNIAAAIEAATADGEDGAKGKGKGKKRVNLIHWG